MDHDFLDEFRERMGDWRERAKDQEWYWIFPDLLSSEDQSELLTILSEIVPKRVWGDGIETYKDFIRPNEARTERIRAAAELLEELRRLQRRSDWISESQFKSLASPFTEALSLARYVVGQSGLMFEGWRKTFLYWCPRKRDWAQVRANRARIIVERRHSVFEQGLDMGDGGSNYRCWLNKHPWRRCQTLGRLFQDHDFEPYTPFWHALNILYWHNDFRSTFDVETSCGDQRISRREQAFNLLHAVEIGQEIGRSCESLEKKQNDVHTLRGIKVADGGRLRLGKRAEHTPLVLAEMKRLIALGHSQYRAAELTFKAGHGTSEIANDKLWQRHKSAKK